MELVGLSPHSAIRRKLSRSSTIDYSPAHRYWQLVFDRKDQPINKLKQTVAFISEDTKEIIQKK